MGMGFVLCVVFDLHIYITNTAIYKFLLSQGLYTKSVLYSKVLIIQPEEDYQKFHIIRNRYRAKQIVLFMEVHSEVQILFIIIYFTGQHNIKDVLFEEINFNSVIRVMHFNLV